MNKQLVAILSILVLIVGIVGVTGEHRAEAKGMPIHNPNWTNVAAYPASQNGHAPAYGSITKILQVTSTVDSKNTQVVTKTTNSTQVPKNKDTITAPDAVKTKPVQQKINRENQLKSESAKTASDQVKSNALIKANMHNLDISVHQKSKQ